MKNFKIPSVPPSSTKCIRFPNELLEEIEAIISKENCSFTSFVVEAVRFSLDNLKENSK